ncbi:methionyl-tRNA formyltransferase [Leucobacter tardus]|uniref:Methionyl-tRNA formyltransferase n=1 Tax=Leucobacter tardus TaxID=501483 RepID=A0A939TRA1_9MICO|nr:methionyl-tRNA formyltransferase [Leucobacter tardus]MBO2989802.1 methionyl-tRNA formyltransferase [Leucobacter tardus]
MRIVFAGTPELAGPSLIALADAGHEIVGVITRADAPIGRKRVLTPSPIAELAEERGIPVHRSNRLDDETLAWVRDLAPDLGVIVAYGGLLREPLLSAPDEGWINLHFSDLPRWRGAAPVQRALMAGERRLGVTVFRLVDELDAGDVLARDAEDFPPGTSAGAALSALAVSGARTLVRAVDGLADGSLTAEPQRGEATTAAKLQRADGRLDLTRPVDAVLDQWAGATPEPGAYAECDGQPLKLLEIRRVDGTPGPPDPVSGGGSEPAAIAVIAGKRALLRLSDGALELVRVQPAGKGAMDGAAWLRGRGGSAVIS